MKEKLSKQPKEKVLFEADLYDCLPSLYSVRDFIPDRPKFQIVKISDKSPKTRSTG